MSGRKTALISAPGAGLGHLVRACAVALRLKEREIKARVVTSSPFAEGMARLTGLDVERVNPPDFPAYAAELKPSLLIIDSFPFGLRGEWIETPHGVKTVFLARRLKLSAYFASLGIPSGARPHFDLAVFIEPVSEDLETFMAGIPSARLPGRIRLPALEGPPLPPLLESMLDRGSLHLVVHSGPFEEVNTLINRAKLEAENSGGEIAAVTPWPEKITSIPSFEYFPASLLFPRAAKIITGAGYNLVAEMASIRDKHTAIPFQRKFDDQPGRLVSRFIQGDGGPPLGETLASLMGGG